MRDTEIRRSHPANKPPFLFAPFAANKGANANAYNQLKKEAFACEQQAVRSPCLFRCSHLSLSKERDAANGANARWGRVE